VKARAVPPWVPGHVVAARMREWVDPADDGFKLHIAVESSPKLWFGVATIRPGTQAHSWTADDETHEAYYLRSGSLKIAWSGPGSGEALLTAGDVFFFAPSHTYRVVNRGSEEVVVVWAVTPAPDDEDAADAP
jgi:uncharacterized RmlC-like cupin family protein